MTRRAEFLADRIEQGAAGLAAFMEGFSDAEWRTPCSANGGDRRPIGVIVHHVASIYPTESPSPGSSPEAKPVTDLTWDIIADLNANHAQDQADVKKAAALDLLRRNSREATAAVRAFTDAELDCATSLSLCFNAPVTAQFVIEVHALRQSWHHLARIRKTLGR